MFRKMPFLLLLMALLLSLLNPYIPLDLKRFALAISLSLKSLIVSVLPFLIFMLLFKTLSKLTQNGTKLILFILACVCLSNFISTMISYEVGHTGFLFDLPLSVPSDEIGLQPLWSFELPKLIQNDQAMFAAVLMGLILPYFFKSFSNAISDVFEKSVGVLLKLLTFIIPVFITGFLVKLIHDGVMGNIISEYSLIFLIVAISLIGYIACIYFVSNAFNFSAFATSLKNMLPAVIAGFSTMSSAAAMPLTMIGTAKNSSDSPISNLAVPVTVNTHLIGDCFAIPIFAFAVLKNFGMEEPAFYAYFVFSLYFVLAKFSVAAIPGGGIIVMLPILESHLGFTSEMSSLITALYVLFDPVITGANVAGNGGFALAVKRLYQITGRKPVQSLAPSST